MPKGNPNPSPETRFGAPNGNLPNGGKTSAQKTAEYEAAEKAAILTNKMLSSIMEKVDAGQDAFEFVEAAVLKLVKDAQDRAHGTPKQSVDVESPEGTMTPTVIERTIVRPDGKGK